ncbi:penicillin-binding protein 2 [bacterium]|nr:penicillin-binding protein 2 [bacterium]MCG2678187.1 penicillin-binding protein 2 [bacterium]
MPFDPAPFTRKRFFVTERGGVDLRPPSTRREFRFRLLFVTVIICLLFLILFLRLWVLEIFQGEKFTRLAEDNSIRLLAYPAPRGLIYDRKGRVLAKSRLSFSITIHPWNLSEEILNETIDHIGPIIGMRKEEIRERIAKWPTPFSSVLLKEDVGLEVATKILERKGSLAGMDVKTRPLRYYPDGELLAPVLGYLGEIGREELRTLRSKGYSLGDRMGQDGLEKVYDGYLRGEDGGWQVQISNQGQRIGVIGYRKPIPGNDLILTIDKRMQEVAWDSLRGRSGAIVVLDPRTGEVLALVSSPTFDPNLFVPRISKTKWSSLKEDPLHPLTNRAIQGQYAPGSIFKVITALAALEKGLISRDERFSCSGTFPFKDRVFRCWRKEGHGELNIKEAIIHSCDIFFYQLGLRVGVDNLVELSQKFGLDQSTRIGLPHEEKGLLPTKRWRKDSLGRGWYEGDTVNLSIGQGYLLVTPLQMASLMSAVANGGRLYEPQLVKEIISSEGETIWRMGPRLVREINLERETIEFLRESLFGVVNELGTGWRAKIEGVGVAGKTGTAENPLGEDHAWFIGFAPHKEPEIALAVLIEHGGMGGEVAAPIAKKIFEAYFDQRTVTSEQ